MKPLLLILLFFFQTAFQNPTFHEQTKVGLMNPAKPSGSLCLGESTRKCRLVLGRPQRISKLFFEMDDDTATVYHYGKNRLYFLKNKLESYQIRDPSILVGEPQGLTFRINDVIQPKSPHRFQGFPIRYEKSNSYNVNHSAHVHLALKKGTIRMDTFFNALFNEKGKLIFMATGQP